MSPHRPLTRLATAGVAGHVFFELAAGVGMPFASVVGPVPAATGWGVAGAATWRAAGRSSPSADVVLTVANGVGLAAVVAHLAGWPRRRTRLGWPWLADCEGLGPELMPLYNPIVQLSGIAALGGLLRENRAAPRWLGWTALGLVPVLVRVQHAEHRRLVRQARTRPGWWNRRLRPTGGIAVSHGNGWARQDP
ncbi:MAG: hypothetical protein JWQ26_1948 [Modestobacter sp.]|nr:hypothetical protein [Modestobacter sp.]